MEDENDLHKIVREMIIKGESKADFQCYLEKIPFMVTISIWAVGEGKEDEQ